MNNNNNNTNKRLIQELKQLSTSKQINENFNNGLISIFPSDDQDLVQGKWFAVISPISESSIYFGTIWIVELSVGMGYPLKAPSVKFVTGTGTGGDGAGAGAGAHNNSTIPDWVITKVRKDITKARAKGAAAVTIGTGTGTGTDAGAGADAPAPVLVYTIPPPHANINFNTGEICLDLLSDSWSPIWNLSTVCIAILQLLDNPNEQSPLNVDIANLISVGDWKGLKGLVKYYSTSAGVSQQ